MQRHEPPSSSSPSEFPPTGSAARRLLTYMITGDADEAAVLQQIDRALAAGVDYVQLRRKKDSTRELEALAFAIAARFPQARGRVLVNDRLDIAIAADLGGLHLPADGFPVDSVRRFAPKGFLVARSTHDRQDALRAAGEGASFIVYGPVFPTSSKPGHPGMGLDALADVVASVSVPVLALGGVFPERVELIAAAGAAGIAGISAFEREDSLTALLAHLDRGRGESS